MTKLGGYIRLLRPINCLMMGFAVLIGASLAYTISLEVNWLRLVYGFITGFTLAGASMVINDYYDREIDAINEPKRPLPSGQIQPTQALTFASALTVVGFVTAYLTNLPCFALAVFSMVVFTTYSTVGKKSGLPGNFLVSVCVAIPFVYGSMAVTGELRLNILLFAAMAFLSNTGREITKGIVDAEGDRTKGIKTLAVRYGEKKAAVTAALSYVLAVLLSPVPWASNLVGFWFIPFVIVTDAGLIYSSLTLVKNPSREYARRTKSLVLLWFGFGLLAFIAGTIR
jgi:geranylgeranylglycerol-phosphate geranylgeranyltransferase